MGINIPSASCGQGGTFVTKWTARSEYFARTHGMGAVFHVTTFEASCQFRNALLSCVACCASLYLLPCFLFLAPTPRSQIQG